MRFVRFGPAGQEKPGILDANDVRRDLSGMFQDWDAKFFQAGGVAEVAELFRKNEAALPAVPQTERWGAPVARPGKVICIGLNYSDHAEESGMPIPAEPILFMKAANTVVGPYDEVQIPRGAQKTDWEVELGVVIGRTARYLPSRESALDCVGGYCISNDVSERAFQLERGGQWVKGKSCDTFNPLGPWLATPDELRDVHTLAMKLWVNGELRQQGTTARMIFDVPTLVHYISQFMTLEPGDLISTGTPPGVGLGMKPPVYLKVGDEMELEIEGLGRQKQLCVATR